MYWVMKIDINDKKIEIPTKQALWKIVGYDVLYLYVLDVKQNEN